MEILEYSKCYEDGVKDLLCELQQYLIKLDEYKIQIMAENYREDYFNNMIEIIKNNNGMIYVAVEDSNVLGFIAGIVEEVKGVDKLTVSLSKFGRVEELCVTDKIRSKGVGTLLMNKMEDYLKSKDCNYIYIDVFGPNIGAQNFYNKKGYNLRNVEVMKKID